ncbi:MAG TPA: hypothetical protein VK132_09075, partial [Gemmatimonadales bacterium]|nr:hypothetical protein [Gemmatimonadales bacterium]
NDLSVLLVELGHAIEAAAAARARGLHQLALRDRAAPPRPRARGPRPAAGGILALTRVAQASRDRLWQHFETSWPAAARAALTRDLAALGDTLARGAADDVPPVPPAGPPPRRLPRSSLRSRYTSRTEP